jgi:hypothetical protein
MTQHSKWLRKMTVSAGLQTSSLVETGWRCPLAVENAARLVMAQVGCNAMYATARANTSGNEGLQDVFIVTEKGACVARVRCTTYQYDGGHIRR